MDKKIHILIVDDEFDFYTNLEHFCTQFEFRKVSDRDTAFSELKNHNFDILLLDLRISPGDNYESGIGFVKTIKEKCIDKNTKIIVVTADERKGTVDKVMNNGAAGILYKSQYELKEWKQVLISVARSPLMSQSNYSFSIKNIPRQLEHIFNKIIALIQHYQDLPLLIIGEQGVGKTYWIQHLYEYIDTGSPFVCHNFSQINSKEELLNILENGLPIFFGFDLLFNNKTNVTDEIRKELIKYIDSHKRIWLISNKKISELNVIDDMSGQELLNRLLPFIYEIPPLRDRRDDILSLTSAFLTEPRVCPVSNNFFGKDIESVFSEDAIGQLRNYHWTGNVKELRAVIRYAIKEHGFRKDPLILSNHLPKIVREYNTTIREDKEDSEKRRAREVITSINNKLSNSIEGSQIARDLGLKDVNMLKKLIEAYYSRFPELFNSETEVVFRYYKTINVIVWYALETQMIYQEFIKHFKPATKKYPVSFTSNNDFEPGIREELLRSKMEQAHLSLMMICIDFLNKEDFNGIVHEYLVKDGQQRRHIPIIARSCGWEDIDPLKKLSPLPTNRTPIESHPNKDEVLTHIVEEIKKVLDSMRR